MKFASSFRAATIGVSAGVLGLLSALSGAARSEPARIIAKPVAGKPPVEINAHYKITLNGFDLGDLQFKSRADQGGYRADSDVQVSALLGAFSWHGVTHSAGSISAGSYRPADYSFDFNGTARSGSVKMGFKGDTVASLAAEPQSFTTADTVPLEQKHLKGALDPLSAILAMTRVDDPDPCGRKLSIFDGKQRFDLVLSFSRNEAASETIAPGQPGGAIVCKVRYVPIAGYRATEETRALAANNGIEIAFRPVPSAGLMLPHRVVIPTIAGDAVLQAAEVNIVTNNRDRVAFVEE